MSTCAEVRPWLAAVAGGESLPTEAADHVGACRDCRRELEDLRALVTESRALGSALEPLPPGFEARMVAALPLRRTDPVGALIRIGRVVGSYPPRRVAAVSGGLVVVGAAAAAAVLYRRSKRTAAASATAALAA